MPGAPTLQTNNIKVLLQTTIQVFSYIKLWHKLKHLISPPFCEGKKKQEKEKKKQSNV